MYNWIKSQKIAQLAVAIGLAATQTTNAASDAQKAKPSESTIRSSSSPGAATQAPAARYQKVGGTYIVKDVRRLSERAFRIEFVAKVPTGQFDHLFLESDHVHMAVKKGETLRLSAEILSVSGTQAEVSQVVLFLPNRRGAVPVWMLSNKGSPHGLRSTTYLKMHVPLNDYIIL